MEPPGGLTVNHRASAILVLVAGAAVVVLAAAALAGHRWGVHADHVGVYTSPSRRAQTVLPWKQPAAPPPENAPAQTGGGFLPWQQPVPPMGISPLPPILRPAPAPAAPPPRRGRLTSWSTGSYAVRWGGGLGALLAPVTVSTRYSDLSHAWSGGTSTAWTYGPRMGRSFIYSSRAGFLGFSSGRFGFAITW